MALEKTVEINVNASQAQKALDDLGGSFEDVYGEAKPLSTVIGELEDRLYEMALAGDTSSDQFKKITKEVGTMRKNIVETDLKIDAMSTTLNQKVGGALGGVTAAFSLGAGVMGAFGVESEKVQEVLLRVQSAMAIQEGVRGIKEAIPSFKALFGTIRAGIAATGIGIFLLALGAIVTFWDDIKGAMSGVSSEQEAINAAAAEQVEIEKKKLEAMSSQENIWKLEGKTQREILMLKRQQTDEIIAATEEQVRQSRITLEQQVKSTEGWRDNLKAVLDFMSIPAKKVMELLNYAGLVSDETLASIDKANLIAANAMFDPEATRAEGEATIAAQEEAIAKLKNDRAGFQLSINAIDKAASDKRVQYAQEEADRIAEIRRISLEGIGEAKTSDGEPLANAPKVVDEEDVEITNEKIRGQKLFDMKQEWRKKDEESEAEHQQRKIGIADRYAENTMKGLQSISSLNDALTDLAVAKAGDNEAAAEKARKKGFERSKKIQIAMAIVQGVQGVMAAFTAGSSMGPAGVVMGPLMAAAAGVSAIANIAKIAKQKYEGGGSSIGAVSVPRVSEPASFNVVGDNGTNQIAEGIGAANDKPVKAYVVGKEVTTQQEMDRNTVETATFG